jgi:hypothetical protein
MVGHGLSEATPFFERLCPAVMRCGAAFGVSGGRSAVRMSNGKTMNGVAGGTTRDISGKTGRDRNGRPRNGYRLRLSISCSTRAGYDVSNTRLARTSDAVIDLTSSIDRMASWSATRRLAWRRRMRSSALRIERALENKGWALRKAM